MEKLSELKKELVRIRAELYLEGDMLIKQSDQIKYLREKEDRLLQRMMRTKGKE